MIVGPFCGEAGYELLYWLPFLRHRLGSLDGHTAITRAGAGVWYPCQTLDGMKELGEDTYVKLLGERVETTRVMKSFGPNDTLDKTVLQTFGVTTDLHPAECYSTIYEAAQWPHERLKKLEPYPDLPERYIAMRFYIGRTFRHVDAARKMIEHGKKQGPVVLLLLRQSCDDHEEIEGLSGDYNVVYGAEGSLETISRVVSNATQFVCTYGGLSYLGPLYGVPTISLADEGVNNQNHTAQEERMIKAVNGEYQRLTVKEIANI